ncbi:hypothetical protein Y032_0052g2202 [Ancylostoma ceylanicum]|uniref:Uncharacterized protein n=1 Tax=Ancylostoma ceylanicum TaxID=53326 RepID=A0A016U8B9_9BILA|nr:hypothetical protein Y032_0052g2202 [Ancylostoma ceylanicum]
MMWSHGVLILMMLVHADAKYQTQEAKLGERVTLQVERDVREWMRVKSDGKKEYVQFCEDTVGLGCNMFADEVGTTIAIFTTNFLIVHQLIFFSYFSSVAELLVPVLVLLCSPTALSHSISCGRVMRSRIIRLVMQPQE